MSYQECPHARGYEGFVPPIGFALQKFRTRRFRGQSQGSKGVHDHVHPEELDSHDGAVTNGDGTGQCKCDSNYIDCKLKLKEFGDGIINVAPPHHSLHNGGKVVICKYDVTGFLSNICASNTLKEEKDKGGG